MGYLSDHAANACMYTSYAAVLIMGLAAAWYSRKRGQFLSANGTRTAIPLTFNFVASGLGAGILVTYPQIGAYGGLQGLLVYSAAGGVPFILFGALGPVIRRRCPEGFVLTEWIRNRYGVLASITISCCTILTIFLFMVSELASIQSAVESLTSVPGLPVLIVECVIVSIYTSMGGFYTSFLTDNIQAAAFLILLVVCSIAVGCTVKIDPKLVGPSHLLKANKLSWKLVYILTVAIVTNDCFMAGFWLRTFASRTDRDLWISCALTGFLLFAICALIGVTGLLAVWGKLLDPSSPTFGDDSNDAFYLVIHSLPAWLCGFVLVMVTMLSACTFDSLQSAMTSSISNDFFRNRVRLIWVRVFVLATMAPCIVVALRATNVLDIYLIVDVLSSCVVPVLFLGLSKRFYWLSGFEIILAVVGGILTVFLYGVVYYGTASGGGSLLIMEEGLYTDDWGVFGAFVAAPVGSFIGAFVGLVIRGVYLAFRERRLLALFDKPPNDASHWPSPDIEWFSCADHEWYNSSFANKLPPSVRSACKVVDFWVFEQPESKVKEMGKWSQRFHRFSRNPEFFPDEAQSVKSSETSAGVLFDKVSKKDE